MLPNLCSSQFSILCYDSIQSQRYNDFEISFNPTTRVLELSNMECISCAIDVTVSECENINLCRDTCETLIPEEPEFSQIIDACKADCIVEFGNDPNALYHCINDCASGSLG